MPNATARAGHAPSPHRCCGCHPCAPPVPGDVNRRDFLGATVLGGAAMAGLTWAPGAVAAMGDLPTPPPRRALKVKPVLVYSLPQRRPQTSWRSWGGLETEADLKAELARIGAELDALVAKADFPMAFLPTSAVHDAKALAGLPDVKDADAVLVYAAGGQIDGIEATGKPTIIFLRHTSGPLSLWYEIVSPRYLRRHTDAQQVAGIEPIDVVVDRPDEVLWRLRALGGLVNTVGATIVAVGGADAWAQPKGVVPGLVKDLWKLDIRELPYEELGSLIRAARADAAAVKLAEARATAYLQTPGTTLETGRPFVVNAMLLDHVFRTIMADAKTRCITINQCMGTIMPLAETSACMALSTLNDDGYLAFCESDFVVIPSGMLTAAISGKPVFLNDPTYPHDGVITLAHCTSPRKLDGSTAEPARIRTHFESDYGAAPQVAMRTGQVVTSILPDFAAKRWAGFVGTIDSNPDLPICRSQIEVTFACDSRTMAERMPGFHWMTLYGDYLKEVGYALRRVPIAFEVLA
jgi:hypothetical protein